MASLPSGPWSLVATGSFPDPKVFADAGVPVEMKVLRSSDSDWTAPNWGGGPASGRYVRFVCQSWYREGCSLQYIGFVYTQVFL